MSIFPVTDILRILLRSRDVNVLVFFFFRYFQPVVGFIRVWRYGCRLPHTSYYLRLLVECFISVPGTSSYLFPEKGTSF